MRRGPTVASLVVALVPSCAIVTDLDGYSGGRVEGESPDASRDQTSPPIDAAPPPPDGGGDAEAGVRVRGVDTKQSETVKVTVTEPAGTQSGDVTLVFLLRTGCCANAVPITAPGEFQIVKSSGFVCNYRSSTFDAYVRTVTNKGPSVFDFTLGASSAVSATLVTIGGLSGVLEATVVANLSGPAPYSLPELSAGAATYFGLSVFTGGAGGTPVGFSSFMVPPGKTRLSDANSIAVFSEDVPPGGSLSNDKTISMSPNSCGFGFAALLPAL